MAQLLIKFKSQDYAELELNTEEEYLVGRSADCDIPLEGDNSLSRKHSKLYFKNGSWVIEKITQSGQLFYNNDEVEQQELENNSFFTIGNFSFTLKEDEVEVVAEEEAPEEKDSEEEAAEEKQTPNPLTPEEKTPSELDSAELTSEYTAIIKTNLTAQLNIYKPGKTIAESVNLTESSWVIGRAKDCNSSINYKKLSRYHFEITKDTNAYWLTDLGSSNGTRLNGVKLKKNESKELKHNDNIKVKSLKVTFEIINEHFQNFQLATINENQTTDNKKELSLLAKHLPQLKKNYLIYVGVAIVTLLILVFFSESPKKKNLQNSNATKLKPEQVQLLEDNLRLAQTHYTSGKYQLCNATLQKIHASIKAYKNSQDLAQYCQQAYQLRQEQEEKRRQVEEKEQLNNKILSIVEKCKDGFTNQTLSFEEITPCLYPAIEINPNHPDIAHLKALVTSKKEQLLNEKVSKANNNQSHRIGLFKYNKAVKLYKKNQLRLAIKAFKRFLNSSHYKVGSLKVIARKKMRQAQKRFNNIVKSSLSLCKKALKNNEYKKAASFCRKTLKQDPENSQAEVTLQLVLKKSRKELKEIYKDSIFEESVGSVELAKKMWRDMLKKGIPNEEYYEKANRKIQKYESL